MKDPLTTKLANLEISAMVSHLKAQASDGTTWAEWVRHVNRMMPSKWKTPSGNQRSAWKNAYRKLLSQYEAIDRMAKRSTGKS